MNYFDYFLWWALFNRIECLVLCQYGLCNFEEFNSEVRGLWSSTRGQTQLAWPFLRWVRQEGGETPYLFIYLKSFLDRSSVAMIWLTRIVMFIYRALFFFAGETAGYFVGWGSSNYAAPPLSVQEAWVVQSCSIWDWFSSMVQVTTTTQAPIYHLFSFTMICV